MGTRLNSYYNDPGIGQAFSNLASIFAPQSPADIAGYAQAGKLNLERQALQRYYDLGPDATSAERDAAGIGANLFDPTGSTRALEMKDATDRYDIGVDSADSRYSTDRTYAASTENNANTVRGNVFDTLYGPLGQGEVGPGVNADVMTAMGFDTGAVDPRLGLPKPLSETEVKGGLLQRTIDEGLLTPEMQAQDFASSIPTEEIIGTLGPEIVPAGESWGKEPFVPAGSAPAKGFKTYTTRDGRTGTAVTDPVSGMMTDEATGERLPPGTVVGDITDTRGGMTTSTNSVVQQRGIAIQGALGTIDKLQGLITNNPSSQGIVGDIRGTAQDLMQTGGELGGLVGGTVQEAVAAAQADPAMAGLVGEMYDPNIPAIDMLTNVLAWQYAKSFSGDRVSNEQLRTARAAIGGGGWLSNQASSTARLTALRQQLVQEAQTLSPVQAGPIQNGLDPLMATPGVPTITDDTGYLALPPGTQFKGPDGKLRTKPAAPIAGVVQ